MYLLDGEYAADYIFAVILGMVLGFLIAMSARPMIRPESWDF
ncbi:MAG: hypothetical protein ACLUOF_08835 [Ruminococcus sp.]